DQATCFQLDVTHIKHAAGIAEPSIENGRDVDIHDVAIAQNLVAGNAVADHVIDGGADRLWIDAIIERAGDRTVLHVKVVAQGIDLVGGYARLHEVGDVVQHLGGQTAG